MFLALSFGVLGVCVSTGSAQVVGTWRKEGGTKEGLRREKRTAE